MARLHHSVAALRIFGDTLDPDQVSRLLGGVSTESFRKGDVKPSKTQNIIRKSGGWMLNAQDQEPGNLDSQIEEIFDKLTQNIEIWNALSKQFAVDLFCGLFMNETDEGIEISEKNLKFLGERGIKLGLCIYAPSENLVADDPCPCNSGKRFSDCCALKE